MFYVILFFSLNQKSVLDECVQLQFAFSRGHARILVRIHKNVTLAYASDYYESQRLHNIRERDRNRAKRSSRKQDRTIGGMIARSDIVSLFPAKQFRRDMHNSSFPVAQSLRGANGAQNVYQMNERTVKTTVKLVEKHRQDIEIAAARPQAILRT